MGNAIHVTSFHITSMLSVSAKCWLAVLAFRQRICRPQQLQTLKSSRSSRCGLLGAPWGRLTGARRGSSSSSRRYGWQSVWAADKLVRNTTPLTQATQEGAMHSSRVVPDSMLSCNTVQSEGLQCASR